MPRAVAFNAETARMLARMTEERRRQPTNKLKRKEPKEPLREFNVICVKAPSDGIAVGADGTCQVQNISSANGLSNAGYTEFVSNIWSTAITADATLIAIRVDNSQGVSRFIAIAEDCP